MGAELTTQLVRGLSQVPSRRAIGEIATTLRQAWGEDEESKLDLDSILNEAGIEFVLSDLGGGEGGPQGLLTPLRQGGYRIEVDPTPSEGWRTTDAALREEVVRHRTRFVIAHELAHTLFYWQGRRGPERLVADSDEQELFCDALASALLVPSQVAAELPLRPASIIDLHRHFDVSVEVAARALITAHGSCVGWLVVVPEDATEPWVQWGAENAADAIGPWGLLSRLAEKVKNSSEAVEGRLRWRSGRTTVARGLFLADRSQLVVTARAG
jgi:hypothetical protein